MKYFTYRCCHAALLLFIVSSLTFLLFAFTPGTFTDEMRLNPQLSRQTLDGLDQKYGMNVSPRDKYWRWLRHLTKGDLGFSFSYNAPVAALLFPRAANTLALTGTATALMWLFALPLGIVSAEKQNTWVDQVISSFSGLLLSIPDLLLALVVLLVALRTRWVPSGGLTSVRPATGWCGNIANVGSHFIAPVIVLVLGGMPPLLRHTRAAMTDALKTPFIVAARAHGLSRVRILIHHALPAAANPLISLFGLSFGSLLSASLLVEVVMGWPGLGPFLLEAILARDVYVVISVVMLGSLFLVIGNLLADVLLLAVDPRIRTEALA